LASTAWYGDRIAKSPVIDIRKGRTAQCFVQTGVMTGSLFHQGRRYVTPYEIMSAGNYFHSEDKWDSIIVVFTLHSTSQLHLCDQVQDIKTDTNTRRIRMNSELCNTSAAFGSFTGTSVSTETYLHSIVQLKCAPPRITASVAEHLREVRVNHFASLDRGS
jgi:hypothetical protein